MRKEAIVDILEETHQNLFTWLEEHPDTSWEKGPENKWTTGQQIQHLVDSIKLLNKALSYPKFLIKYRFGVSNRETRSYEAVTKRYHERLAESRERAAVYNRTLKTPSLRERERLITVLQIQNKKLQYKTKKWKDKDLDTLLLPHPLMGRMTVREIIMWTAHHTEHHTKILKAAY